MVVLLWLHAAGLPLVGALAGIGPLHGLVEAGAVALAAVLAGRRRINRRLAAGIVAFGLFTASAVLVHLSGAYIEMHFHFFVMIAVVALYQDWIPFLVGLGYVVVHHGLIGTIAPTSVYNHPEAQLHPWRWAGIHGAFILAASVAALINWRLKEEEYARRLAEERRAATDPLTGLLSRRALEEAVDARLTGAVARGAPLSLLLVDLDDLKRINDRHGHLVGDRVLREVAALLGSCLRAGDHAGRYGGDEFLLALADTDAGGAAHVVERLRKRAEAVPIDVDGLEMPLRLSVGAAIFPRDGANRPELIATADAAMYAAKRARVRRPRTAGEDDRSPGGGDDPALVAARSAAAEEVWV
jgi:diguanylate cyclase (GGDEF)-like protein